MPNWYDYAFPMVTYPTRAAIGAVQGATGISGDPTGVSQANALNDAIRNQNAGFAGQLAGDVGALNPALAQQRGYLGDVQSGKVSQSREMLRQALQQQVQQQRSAAASASPQNRAMAALTAANNMGRASYGMAGQGAMADIAERNAATSQLGSLLLGERGQDISGANAGYGNALGNPYQSLLQQYAPIIQAGGAALGAAASDRRLKKDVGDGDAKSKNILKALKSHTFKYKDEKYGKGEQYGVMAQDLQKAGLGHAVIDTPAGKMVDGAKTATSSLALVAALGRRVEKLEKGRK